MSTVTIRTKTKTRTGTKNKEVKKDAKDTKIEKKASWSKNVWSKIKDTKSVKNYFKK